MGQPDMSAESVAEALPEVLHWSGRPTAAELARLPNSPAVYLLATADGAVVQLATAQALKRVLVSRLAGLPSCRSGKADLGELTRMVRWRRLSTGLEGRWWYYRLARELYPQEYRRLISFGPAYFLHVDWEQPVPQLGVTERVWCLPGRFAGPWPTEAECRKVLEGLTDLFDLCRQPAQLRRAPRGTRCAYADLGRCDAPCDGSAPLSGYVARCRAAWDFLCGGMDGWIERASRAMAQAAREQRFELAGRIKQQLEFARQAKSHWARWVRPAEELDCLLALRVHRRRAWKLLLLRRGELIDGPVCPQRNLGPEAMAWTARQLSQPETACQPTVRMEQTWLVSRYLIDPQRGRAIVIRLAGSGVPPDLDAVLTREATKLAGRRKG